MTILLANAKIALIPIQSMHKTQGRGIVEYPNAFRESVIGANRQHRIFELASEWSAERKEVGENGSQPLP